MVVPGANEETLDGVAKCVGCKESIAGLENGFVFLPKDHTMFMLRTLFEDQTNGPQA